VSKKPLFYRHFHAVCVAAVQAVRCGIEPLAACFPHARRNSESKSACVARLCGIRRACKDERPPTDSPESLGLRPIGVLDREFFCGSGGLRYGSVSLRRAACAVLAGVITLIAEEKAIAARGRIDAGIFETEVSPLRTSKGVPVFRAPPDKNTLSMGLNVVNLGLVQNPSEHQEFWHRGICTETCGCYLRNRRYNEIGFFGNWKDINLGPRQYVVRWRLAGIAEHHDRAGLIKMIRQRDRFSCSVCGRCTFRKEISPQLATAGTYHDANSADQRKELRQCRDACDSSNFIAETPSDKPTIAPLLWSLLVTSCGFGLAFIGLLNLDNERRLLGPALLGCGLLLGGWGFLMWAMPL
jgi:hypothetical protein